MEKILLIIPNFGSGGAQRSFSNLSNELGKGFQVVNVVFNLDRPVFYPLEGEIINLNVNGGGNIWKKILNFFLRVIRLRKIKKVHGITTSISFLEGADYVNVLAKINDKIILSIRGSKLHDGNITGLSGLIRKKILIPLLYRKANEIVVVNKGIVRELDEFFNLKHVPKTVINNFYDKESILEFGNAQLPNEYNWLSDEKYIVISSRLAREKNILGLISVFAALKRLGFKGKMVIVGDGPEAMKIDSHCQILNLKKFNSNENKYSSVDVICVGADDNPFRFVKRALCFIMASESEGFPNVLIESMILGVPVISSDCPWGPREILDPNMQIKSINLTQPVRAKLGILMPLLTDSTFCINLWAEYLYDLLNDKVCLQHYSHVAPKGVEIYSKQNIMTSWLSVINK